MFYEWTRIVRAAGAPRWTSRGFFYALLPALALLWIRERRCGTGSNLLLWVFIVTWATDIGAYFVGRAIRPRQARAVDQPGQDGRGPVGGIAAAALLGGAWVLAIGLGLPLLCPRAALRRRRAGRRSVRKLDEAPGRGQGLRATGSPGHGGLLDRLDGLVPVAVLTALGAAIGAGVRRKIAILGATGSVGKSTLDLVERSPSGSRSSR